MKNLKNLDGKFTMYEDPHPGETTNTEIGRIHWDESIDCAFIHWNTPGNGKLYIGMQDIEGWPIFDTYGQAIAALDERLALECRMVEQKEARLAQRIRDRN